jgi:hypothetical protein
MEYLSLKHSTHTHTHTHTHGWMHVSNKYIAVIKHEGTILLKEFEYK